MFKSSKTFDRNTSHIYKYHKDQNKDQHVKLSLIPEQARLPYISIKRHLKMSFNPFVLYHNKYSNPPLPPPQTFLNKTILITGANTGLGLALALHCLNLGASHLILTTRSPTKSETTKAYLETHTTSKAYTIEMMHLDMLTFESVVEFANKVKREVLEIDVVYLNAGVLNMKAEKVISAEGWEVTMQINVLSTALLAILLVPWMKVAGKGQAHLAFSGSGCK